MGSFSVYTPIVENGKKKIVVQHDPLREVRVGSLVEIQIPNGIGRDGQEYKTVKARVHMVLPTHVVCVVGNREGHPHVAERFRVIRW